MTAPAKHLDLSVLPPEYRAEFEAQAARVAQLEEINKRQEHLIAEMQHALYGKKSEKLADDDRQLAFEDLEVALAEVEERKSDQAPDDDKPKRKKIAKRNRGNLPEGLPRIERVIEPDSLDCPCGCGVMHRIGEDRNERLDIVPAQCRVIVTVRPKYACRTCTDGVTQVPTPPWLIEGGLPTEGAIFAGHDEGGRAWGRIASLIESAKINGVEPFAYLKSTLEAIAAGHPKNRIDDLLPRNFQPSS